MQSAVLVPLIAAWHRDRALSLADALTRARAAFPQLCLAYSAPALAMIAAAWLYSPSDAAALVSEHLAVTRPRSPAGERRITSLP